MPAETRVSRIEVMALAFAARCVLRGCAARAVTLIRPTDTIGRAAGRDILVCAAHERALTARAGSRAVEVADWR
jgi:hypothetical protein